MSHADIMLSITLARMARELREQERQRRMARRRIYTRALWRFGS
jgi:hypothetical protein